MPIINVEMFPGRTIEQKRAFTKAVTDAFVTTCGGTPQSVHVIFRSIEKEDWATGGKLASDPAPTADAKKS